MTTHLYVVKQIVRNADGAEVDEKVIVPKPENAVLRVDLKPGDSLREVVMHRHHAALADIAPRDIRTPHCPLAE